MRTLTLLVLATAAFSANAAEWDQAFRAPAVANRADFFVQGSGTTAFVFERVPDSNADYSDDRVILRRVDRATTQVFAATLDAGMSIDSAETDGSRVCATFFKPTTSGVQCFSAATGARTLNYESGRTDVGYEIWDVAGDTVRVTEYSVDPQPPASAPARRVLDVLGNGTVRTVATLSGGNFDRVATANDAGAFLRIDGSALIAQPGQEDFYLYGNDGTLRGDAISSPFNQPTQRSRTVILPDGSAAILGRRTGGNSVPAVWSVLRIGANGEVLWFRDFPGAVGYPQIRYAGQELIVSYGSTGAVLAPEDQRDDIDIASVLISVNPQTGAETWRTTFPSAFNGAFLVEGRGNEIVHVLQIRTGVYLRRFDRATGQLVATDRRSCGTAFCGVEELWIDGEGGLQLGVGYPIDQNVERWAILRESDPFAAVVARYDVASPAIEGAWYNPTTNGQGLVIDRIANQNLMFATWFTYVADPAPDDARGLRWLTLQGTISGDGTTIENLGIFQNTNGAFGTGSTTATRVGTARLLGLDCNTLRLEYDFDAASGLPDGVTTLVRATPAGYACTLPYPQLLTPRGGFDAAQTGHWFAPSIAGQGFSFVVTPATDTANGSLLGAWFTYDVTADDPRAQHWFTLGATIAPNAGGGTVNATLYRSTGGAFEAEPVDQTDAVGTATVTFTSCNTARVAYVFDADAGNGYGGRSGTIDLVGEACN